MSGPGSRRQFLIGAAGVTLGAATLLGSPATAAAAAYTEDATTPTAIDVGFCADMTVHHVQALAMCQRVLGRPTGDPVQVAAVEVMQTQAIEVGMMRAWLTDWGQSTAPHAMAMGWMGMNDGEGMPTAMMPGLATDDEMRALAVAEGLEQGRLWLELMRSHHVGGVNMATAAADMATSEKVRRLATVQVRVQSYEIGQYDLLLATDYA